MYAAIYCRKSVNTHRGESMQSQIDHCRACLAAHRSPEEAAQAWVYQDEGFSGAALYRPAMQRLLSDIRANIIHCVVCYRLDRISRSVSDFTALMEEFARHQVSFLCASEEFDTAKPMGRAMLYIASVFSQLERETIAERVRDNMYTLAAGGRWMGGPPPYGYQILRTAVPKAASHLAVLESEFAVVQDLFRIMRQGGSLALAEQRLQIYRNRQGKRFSRRYLRAMLQNPVYAAADSDTAAWLQAHGYQICFSPQQQCRNGVLVYGKHPNHSAAEMLCLAAEGLHPAVCSGAEWCALQAATMYPRPRCSAIASLGLLRGRLRCGCCGDIMQCKKRSGRDGQYDYLCRSKARAHACDCRNLQGVAADRAVWNALLVYLPSSAAKQLSQISQVARIAVCSLVVEAAEWNGETLTLTLRR